MLIYLGRLNDAEKVLLSAKKIAPANPLLEKNLKFIRTGSYK
jgi:Flp pilus assembly protein TadD